MSGQGWWGVAHLSGGQRRPCGRREWRNDLAIRNLLMSSGWEQQCVGSCTSSLMRKGTEMFSWSQKKIWLCRRNKYVLGSWTGSSCTRGNEEWERARAGVGLPEEETRLAAGEVTLVPVLTWKRATLAGPEKKRLSKKSLESDVCLVFLEHVFVGTESCPWTGS